MFLISRNASSSRSKLNWRRGIPWLLLPVLVLSFAIANAQVLTGTLSGTAEDQTGAKIQGASVTVVSDTTGDKRDTKADSSGLFSVTALPPGTYTVTVTAKGFSTWKETGILMNEGDSRTIPNIHLKISSDVNSVTVVSGADAEVPTDTAEISTTLNNELVDSAVLTGRNAAELIKMMPGVAFNNGGGVGSAYNSQVTGTNNGPAGNFSANGTQPYGSTAVILDGANLIDPGNAGTQIANINQDMTDSVKYLSASYGAEYAKGPAILEAFSKSGSQKYHGEGYLYARNSGAGYANDWNAKHQGSPLYPQYYYYAGGNVGGPISLLGFNKNKDKLFFWGGYEKMIQHPYNSPVEMNVPTGGIDSANHPGQLDGNFNNDTGEIDGSAVSSYVLSTWSSTYALPCTSSGGWQGCSTADSPWGGYAPGGGVTAQPAPNLAKYFDPNGVLLTGINPKENQLPNANNGWNNFGYSPVTPNDRWEATGKVTYAFNDNNKLWGSYTYQTEADNHPLSVWWAPEWTVPYPSDPVGKETAKVYLVNYTHVFNATTTNEFVFSYANFVNAVSQSNPTASLRSTVGFPTESLYGSAKASPQIPNATGGWNSGLTEINEFSFNGGIYGKNSFGKTAKAPAISDNFTKIIKTHSIKAGFYWDSEENLQSAGSDTNGNYDVETWGGSSTNNLTLDRLMGRNQTYNEQSTDPVPDELWHQWSIWGQDSWKLNPKTTINVGLRLDHEGQWYDKLGGTQVWDPATYVNTAGAPANTGLEWNAIDKSVPTSGWGSNLFLVDPRVGFAYDFFGTGKTVIRGGFGTYRYQVSDNDAGGAMGGPLGSYNYATGTNNNGFYGYNVNNGVVCTGVAAGAPSSCSGTATLPVPQGLNQNGSSGVKADVMGDNKVPYANTWSFGVAQALPSHTVAQASYVGSMSRNQLLNGANGHIEDANGIASGALFLADPKTGYYENTAPISPQGQNYTGVSTNDWRPLNNYGDIWLQSHGGYANYNSLQVAAQKQSGNLFLFTNFTFGKVLGTRDGSTSNGNGNGPVVNPFDLASNYGQLEYDHTKVFNVSFSYKMPSFIHNNFLLGEAVNGWQFSGYTTYQDGAPYQTTSPNMNMQYHQNNNATNVLPAGVACTAATAPCAVPFSQPLPADTVGQDGNNNNAPVIVGNQTINVGTNQWLGSSQYENGLQPVLTCDPRKGLAKGQYFNPKCFTAPLTPTATSWGQNGQTIWPYIRTPHYIGSDLAIFKAFKITESQRFEVRVSATNWLNHPNAGFGINGNADNELVFNGIPGIGNPGANADGSVTNSNNGPGQTTGTPAAKLGYRWMQFAGKYYF
jgi:hypothetical protein